MYTREWARWAGSAVALPYFCAFHTGRRFGSEQLFCHVAGLPSISEVRAALNNVTNPLGGVVRQNLWVNRPPTLSRLHFDSEDSLLVQLVGTKRFTLVDPLPLHGLTTHPVILPVRVLQATARTSSV